MRISCLVFVVAAFFSSGVFADDATEAAQVVNKWAQAFQSKDLASMLAFYAGDAQFWGTTSKELVVAPEGIRKYFETAFATITSPRVVVNEQKVNVISAGVVIIATTDEVSGSRDGKEFSSPGRTTWLIAKRGDAWRILQFHRSVVPR